ncbi:MAG: hypothetical protein AAF798_15840 [Bacteroidota bacterium]
MRNNNLVYLSLLVVAGFLAWSPLAAQDLGSEEVEIIKEFDARLIKTPRLGLRPDLPPLDTTTKRQTYNILNTNLEVEYLPPKIRPIAMRRQKLAESFNHYVKLGGGFPSMFLGEGSFNLITKSNFDLGLDVNHLSANNNNSLENQRFSGTNVKADGTYFFEKGFAVNGRVGYTLNNEYFYGYNELSDTLSFDSDNVRQRFSIFDIGASIFNGARTVADFNYFADVDAYFMEDNFAARENGFDLRLGGTKWFSEKHPLTIVLRTDFTNYRDTSDQNLNNFHLQPSFTYHGETFTAKIGFNLTSNEDDFSIFPEVEGAAKIIEGSLTAFVGATGNLQKNNLRSLSAYNPYIETRLTLQNSRFYDFYGGVRGTVEGIDYDARIGYKSVENLPLFLWNGDSSIVAFRTLYDTANIVYINATVTAPLFDGFELVGNLTQRFYSLDREEDPWHLPALTLNFTGIYTTLEDKLRLRADLFFENGVLFLNTESNESETLNALFDVSIGAEYFFTKNIGAFAQINNLANNERQRWNRYPILGTNALVGITAKF